MCDAVNRQRLVGLPALEPVDCGAVAKFGFDALCLVGAAAILIVLGFLALVMFNR